jgi:hypothetical protein
MLLTSSIRNSHFLDCRLQEIYYSHFGDISLRGGPLPGSGSYYTEDSALERNETAKKATATAGTSSESQRALDELVSPLSSLPTRTSTEAWPPSVVTGVIHQPAAKPSETATLPATDGRRRFSRAGERGGPDNARDTRGGVGTPRRRKAAGKGKGRPSAASTNVRSRSGQSSKTVGSCSIGNSQIMEASALRVWVGVSDCVPASGQYLF